MFFMVTCLAVHQKDLVKDVTICQDIRVSEYKLRHPDDSEDPSDIGLSSEDEAMGMDEEIGIAHRITVSRPSPANKPSTATASKLMEPPTPPAGASGPPEGYIKLGQMRWSSTKLCSRVSSWVQSWL